MTPARLGTIIGPLIVGIGWVTFASGQPLPDQTASLRDLDNLRVEIVLTGASAAAALSESTIRADVEARLRLAGIGVRDATDRSARGDPRLRVTLQAIDAAGGYAFLVSIQVIERVVAYRKYVELVFDGVLPTTPTASVDPLEIGAAIRWEVQALGTTRREGAGRFIPNAALGYVDRFVDDYLAAQSR